MNCNKTETFFAEWERMCVEADFRGTCFLVQKGIAVGCAHCEEYVRRNADKAIEIVQEWSDAHQPKTRLSVLKEQYPRYEYRNTDGLPTICAGVLYGFSCGCTATNVHDCERCWNTPVEQELW